MMKRNFNVFVYFGEKLRFVILLLLAFIGLGILGFMLLEDLNFTEAAYMTVITLSTVGYRELREPNNVTMWFTVILILSGVGVLTYSASIFAQELIDGRFLERYKQKRVENKIMNFNKHVIICGFGRNGQQAARKLIKQKISFIAIEKDDDLDLPEDLQDTIIYTANATEDEVLSTVGIKKAKALIVALPSDADNLFITLSAKQLNPNLKIVSRAADNSTFKKLKIAGADHVVMPNKLGGEHMARLLALPQLAEFIEAIGVEGSHHVDMLEIDARELPSGYIGKTLYDLNFRPRTKCTVVGFKNREGEYELNPDLNHILEKESKLIFMGTPQQIINLAELYGIPYSINT